MRFLLLVLLMSGATGASAQTAADQYHDAAGLYISGDLEAAEQAAEAGLAIDPDDAKLQALLERIRQQQEQRNQQHSDEGEPSDETQNPQNEQRSEGESDQQDSEQQDDGQGEQDQPQDDGSAESDQQNEQREPEHQEDQQNQAGRENEQQEPNRSQTGEDEATPEDPTPIQLGRMSRAEAERILAALRADESALLRSIQRRPASTRRVERDW